MTSAAPSASGTSRSTGTRRTDRGELPSKLAMVASAVSVD
jgi:hypothetical protein